MYYDIINGAHLKGLKNLKFAYHFYIITTLKFIFSKFFNFNCFLNLAQKRGKVLGKKFYSNKDFNSIVYNKIISSDPFFICRYGNSEFSTMVISELKQNNVLSHISDSTLKTAKMGPGVFPENEDVYVNFSNFYKKSISEADLNAYWGNVIMEEYFLKRILKSGSGLFAMRALEPFQYKFPWTAALKGKKVLFVSPMSEHLKSQYKKKAFLFENKNILTDFEINCVTSCQSSGNNIPEGYSDWFDSYEHTLKKCFSVDFDIALLSCGSYAVPIAAEIKKRGKQAIVMGGMMQLMFGIKGQRWEASRPDIVALYNDNWIRQDIKFRVKDADKMVDGAAYW